MSTQSQMTRRDYLAGQALMGLLTRAEVLPDDAEIARRAWRLADAMMATRHLSNDPLDSGDAEKE
jgi:hypothetical protein